ncbi:MAG: aminotransferase class I/II-fold pyridoxal phosphate-dependent enzyme [Chromatiaceae bacterium]|nr:aminotransferase class I/II-fold pyridoxal phosphate-dependent enzyme [Chromatiaceae bacterium]MCP5445169.1 aminotransferase class I/II-fold pyridoxal phosphate-dependent enzyme [Chromatiaceae bacterium]
MSINTEALLTKFKADFLNDGRSESDAPEDVVFDPKAMDITATDDYRIIQEMREFYSREGRHNPYFLPRKGRISDRVSVQEREYISYSGYNYLGLSDDERVIHAAQKALDVYGTHAGAARMVGGEIALHQEMERTFADAFGFEECVASVGGYMVNVMTIGYLLGSGDVVFMDEYMHNSGMMGGVMAHARRVLFPHNDLAALERLLQQNRNRYSRAMILVEGAYSMDGDLADLPRLLDLKRKYRAWLMVDEAHSLGVVGATGRGVCEHWNVDPRDVDIIMGTLSKSFASCGGFIGGSREMIATMRHFAPGLLLYSTGLPPASTAAALEALRIMLQEPERVRKLQHNAHLFVQLARERGLEVGCSGASAVVPVMLGESSLALQLMSDLMESGIIAHAVMYPVVPRNKARLRFFLTSRHTEAQFVHTLDLLQKLMQRYQAG